MNYEAECFPGEVHVYAASLNDQGDVAASRHVYVEEQVGWFEVYGDLPSHTSTSKSEPTHRGPR